MTNQQTQYFRESIGVKSYIDFSDDNYQESSYSDLQKGIINIDAAMQLLEPKLKKKADLTSIPVLIIPKTLPNGIPNIESPTMFPLGILYIPALLTIEGHLVPPEIPKSELSEISNIPWIPRDILLPFNLQKTAIGEWQKYPSTEKSFGRKDFQFWEDYLIAAQTFYENALGVSWTTKQIVNHLCADQLLTVDDTVYIISDPRIEAKHFIRNLYDP